MSTAAPTSEPIDTHNVPLPTPAELPDDLGTLKRMIVELMTTLRQERLDKEKLRFRIEQLLRQRYGPRTERFNPDQLLLFADWAASPNEAAASAAATGAGNAAAAEATTPSRPRRPKTPHGRGKLPDDLPRHEVHHRLSEAERICRCGEIRVDIGTDVNEQVEWQPASLFVWQHIVHKYLCPDCAAKSAEGAMASPVQTPQDEATTGAATAATADAATADAATADAATADAATPTNAAPATTASATDVMSASLHAAPSSETPPTPSAVANSIGPAIGPAIISAPKPPPPIAKGLPGPGLLAYIIVSKYFDHLPLYRLEHIMARQGLPLSRSTMCDWMAASALALRPLYDAMVSHVLQSAWLHTDDTSVKNLGHAPGTTALSRFWIYWGDRTHPYNVFDFTINRKRDGPQTFLETFHGYLHADAFSGYDALYLPPPRPQPASAASDATVAAIFEVACNAHARRKFHEARGSDDLRAHQALAYYAQLYTLERGATDAELDDDARLRMRQELAVPILEQFHKWLTEQRAQVLPKSPMAEAIGYALNNWTALIRYTEAGFLSIDNNVAEREMKRIAIGRKNWLFVGSAKGGHTAAVLFSFTSTCHRLGIEPWAYLQDVLSRLPSMPAERIAELLPDRWQAARQQATQANAAPSANSASTSPSVS